MTYIQLLISISFGFLWRVRSLAIIPQLLIFIHFVWLFFIIFFSCTFLLLQPIIALQEVSSDEIFHSNEDNTDVLFLLGNKELTTHEWYRPNERMILHESSHQLYALEKKSFGNQIHVCVHCLKNIYSIFNQHTKMRLSKLLSLFYQRVQTINFTFFDIVCVWKRTRDIEKIKLTLKFRFKLDILTFEISKS